MQIRRLTTFAFRNLADATLEFDPRCNVISGDNAQGKTNLLEAIDLTLGQRPFRATRTAELIRFAADAAALQAEVCHADVDHRVTLKLGPRGRLAEVDGKALRSAAAWPRGLTSVLFTPDDLVVPKGSPSERRRLLDRAVQSVWPTYASLLRAYTRALSARNRLLRDRPPQIDPLLDAYDAALAQHGAKIALARGRYVAALREEFCRAHRSIGGQRDAELRYCPSVAAALDTELAVEQVAQRFGEALRAARREDFARRATSTGPHHDDLSFELDGRPARLYGSQGQIRTLVLAFKIAQIHHIHRVVGNHPVLLLDDVSSELDARRNSQLFAFINQIRCQLFVTTTRRDLIPAPDSALYLSVIKGQIS